jgi:hypothetical protein
MAAFDLEHGNEPAFARHYAVPPADRHLMRQ